MKIGISRIVDMSVELVNFGGSNIGVLVDGKPVVRIWNDGDFSVFWKVVKELGLTPATGSEGADKE